MIPDWYIRRNTFKELSDYVGIAITSIGWYILKDGSVILVTKNRLATSFYTLYCFMEDPRPDMRSALGLPEVI